MFVFLAVDPGTMEFPPRLYPSRRTMNHRIGFTSAIGLFAWLLATAAALMPLAAGWAAPPHVAV